ncbi:MAG: DNA translocase FtsK [Lachnospiraceae bacterium]|nr:DNA translocase FtsK [Lachnospiraceae bacterium]
MAAKPKTRQPEGGDKSTKGDYTVRDEIISIVLIAAMVYLFLSNFGIGGRAGNAISSVLFGLFGLRAYLAPVLIGAGAILLISNAGSLRAVGKVAAGAGLFFLIGIVISLFGGYLSDPQEMQGFKGVYLYASETHGTGGVFATLFGRFLYRSISLTGTVLLLIVLILICLVLLTNRLPVHRLRVTSGERLGQAGADYRAMRKIRAREREEERVRKREERALLREQQEADEQRRRAEREEAQRRQMELEASRRQQEEDAKILRVHKKALGVTEDTDLTGESAAQTDGMHVRETAADTQTYAGGDDIHEIVFTAEETVAEEPVPEIPETTPEKEKARKPRQKGIVRHTESVPEAFEIPAAKREDIAPAKKNTKPYRFPPLSLLHKADKKKDTGGGNELKETAAKLEGVLQTFGVNAHVVDFSRGPSVTRYELQPEVGVKVSRILNLADDIKLNLAATDIRIEAPIPGKVAVGIEVPNAETVPVTLRELLESKQYREAESRLSFAVGKDIAGETIVTDIAKMPHLLIAGATGSGKSVCINTLILSVLYKADPEEVRLIMVDPKVVELNMYNGIPHLLIPVVTEPKKAAGALNWAVAEMEKRYRLFADAEVRDLAGYNQYVDMHQGEEGLSKLPQIVLVVDELADLMMVSKSEVETAICRLAQLARAAGIHLIIATQRPSVDVITGLIKANMPSRIAFAVSSGTDSRTILDMNGAEKLLGKGDMLFFPQNYSKPVRVQGAFVSDKEIQDVCEFLKQQNKGAEETQAQAIEGEIARMQASSGDAQSAGAAGSLRDEYFAEAGRFIIGKEKASIGNLQRVFKIGFNRAARIMDQLCEAGVVGEEEGTKPRRILMSMEEFEEFCKQEA